MHNPRGLLSLIEAGDFLPFLKMVLWGWFNLSNMCWRGMIHQCGLNVHWCVMIYLSWRCEIAEGLPTNQSWRLWVPEWQKPHPSSYDLHHKFYRTDFICIKMPWWTFIIVYSNGMLDSGEKDSLQWESDLKEEFLTFRTAGTWCHECKGLPG